MIARDTILAFCASVILGACLRDAFAVGYMQPRADAGDTGASRDASTDALVPPPHDGGYLDPNALARVVRAQLSAIRSCYEHDLRHDQTMRGRVEVHFRINADGTTNVLSSTPTNPAMAQTAICIALVFGSLQFPPPSGGTVEASFSFNFTPEN